MLGLGLLIGGLAVEKIRWNWGTFSVSLFAGLIAGSNSLEPDAMMFASAFAACEKRAKVGDARRGGISWRCLDAVNSQLRKGYATCMTIPSPDFPIHRGSLRMR